ncbi:MAG: methyl-accepting chemotaxis protein [Shewanella sp.]
MQIPQFTIGRKLAIGFSSVLLVMFAAIIYSNGRLIELDKAQDTLVTQTFSNDVAGLTLQAEISKSLAIIHAYLILGKPELKDQRQEGWINIDNLLAQLSAAAVDSPIEGFKEKISNLKELLSIYRSAQDEVEAVAHTENEQPAMKIFKKEFMPQVDEAQRALFELSRLEDELPATPVRKKLLGLFDQLSSNYLMILNSVGSYLMTGDVKLQQTFEQYWQKNSLLLTNNQHLTFLTSLQRQQLTSYQDASQKIKSLASKMFAIRATTQWNMSQHLLAQKTKPAADNALLVVNDLIALQVKNVKQEINDLGELTASIITILQVSGFFGLVLGIFISVVITRSVALPILKAKACVENVASTGNYSLRLDINTKDELGQLAQSFNSLMNETKHGLSEFNHVMARIAQGDLSVRVQGDYSGDLLAIKQATNASLENIEQSAHQKMTLEAKSLVIVNENAQVRQALDSASNNIMIADGNNEIIYINHAATAMLHSADADFGRDIHNFDPNNVLGLSIDKFYRQQQVNLLQNITTAHLSELKVGNRIMAINAMPMFDTQRTRIGTMIEWRDRTDEVAIEYEVDTVIAAAAFGDFSKRINMDNKNGFFFTLAKGLNNLSDNIENSIVDMQSMLAAMAKGNLTLRIDKNYGGRLGQLKSDANQTVEKLTEVILKIRETAATISNTSREIVTGNQNLSRRTELQASSLQTTSSSMDDMTKSVKHSAENALATKTLSTDARIRAREGGTAITRTISAMKEISHASNEIAEIVGVIDEIAFQTNLLALNAAVEAARAGDQGRGFAVVAGEVRNLAQRSATAAKEIKQLIQASNKKVAIGESLVNESGVTLNEIVTMIEAVGDKMEGISDAAQEQSRGIEQVNTAVARMDDMTQQNAELVEEASSASESMWALSQEMTEMVAFFELLEDRVSHTPPSAPYKPNADGIDYHFFDNNDSDDWEKEFG